MEEYREWMEDVRNVLQVNELIFFLLRWEVLRGENVESAEDDWEKFREKMGVNGGVKLVGLWKKREEFWLNGCRKQMVIHMTSTRNRELLWKRQLKLEK